MNKILKITYHNHSIPCHLFEMSWSWSSFNNFFYIKQCVTDSMISGISGCFISQTEKQVSRLCSTRHMIFLVKILLAYIARTVCTNYYHMITLNDYCTVNVYDIALYNRLVIYLCCSKQSHYIILTIFCQTLRSWVLLCCCASTSTWCILVHWCNYMQYLLIWEPQAYLMLQDKLSLFRVKLLLNLLCIIRFNRQRTQINNQEIINQKCCINLHYLPKNESVQILLVAAKSYSVSLSNHIYMQKLALLSELYWLYLAANHQGVGADCQNNHAKSPCISGSASSERISTAQNKMYVVAVW